MFIRRVMPGVNFIDIADVYVAGKSEEFVGRAIKGSCDRIAPRIAENRIEPISDLGRGRVKTG